MQIEDFTNFFWTMLIFSIIATGVDKLPVQKRLVIPLLLSVEFVWDPKDKHDEKT
jgi:hypothetical protein